MGIYKLAKKGLTPSQIGVILRDSHGVAQVRFITGNKILRILKGKGMAPALPEDCYYLIKKAVSTDWPDITRPRVFCLPPGNTRALPPPPWWPKLLVICQHLQHLSSSTCCSSVQYNISPIL